MLLTTIPTGLPQIIQIFGDPSNPNFYRDHIIMMNLPFPMYYGGKLVKRTQVHRLAAEHFTKALVNVKDAGMAEVLAKEFNGIYEDRMIRGSHKFPSLHAFGVAGDFLATDYPLGSGKRMSGKIIQAFKDAGFIYGGDFTHRKDPQHFQLAKGY